MMCVLRRILVMRILQWQEFMNLGAQVPDEALEHRISQLAPNKCCTLIYTVPPALFELFQIYNNNNFGPNHRIDFAVLKQFGPQNHFCLC